MKKYNDIRLANQNDLLLVFDLFKRCTRQMIESGLDQWNDNYPNQKILEKDIRSGEMWIYKEENDLATITLNEFQDIQYQEVTWKYVETPILVIHRLAVHPGSRGKGLGKYLCQFAEYYAKQKGYKSIRLDTYSINPVSMGLYKGLGYRKTKESVFFDGPSMPVYCFEKKL